MTATVIRNGTVGEQPPAPIWVRIGGRTNITRFTYASSSHAPIAKLIRKRTIIGVLNVAFHPLEHKLGYTSCVIHRDSALVNVCHAEKGPWSNGRDNTEGRPGSDLANVRVAKHNARGERIGQVDYLLGTNKNRFPRHLASASPGQVAARTAMLGSEIAHRDRASGRACPSRRGSPFPSRSRASTGPTSRSPTAGAATRCPSWRSYATRRTWSFFADDKLAAAIVDRVVHHAGSWSSADPATGSRSPSCWESREGRGGGAPVTKPEKVACRNPKDIVLKTENQAWLNTEALARGPRRRSRSRRPTAPR